MHLPPAARLQAVAYRGRATSTPPQRRCVPGCRAAKQSSSPFLFFVGHVARRSTCEQQDHDWSLCARGKSPPAHAHTHSPHLVVLPYFDMHLTWMRNRTWKNRVGARASRTQSWSRGLAPAKRRPTEGLRSSGASVYRGVHTCGRWDRNKWCGIWSEVVGVVCWRRYSDVGEEKNRKLSLKNV